MQHTLCILVVLQMIYGNKPALLNFQQATVAMGALAEGFNR